MASATTTVYDKVDKLFKLFDFQSTGLISYDELFILVGTAFTSLRKITCTSSVGGPDLPRGVDVEDSDLEKIGDEVFLLAEVEPSIGKITAEHLKAWVTKELNLGTKKGEVKFLTQTGVLVSFDLLEDADAKEIEENRMLMGGGVKLGKNKKHHHHHRTSEAHGHHGLKDKDKAGRVSPSH